MSEVAVLSAVRQRAAMPLRGRSYMAFALAPQPPIAEWLEQLDAWLSGASGFFTGRPVVLDLAAVTLTSPAVAYLIAELGSRGIRVMGLEGIDAGKVTAAMPPLLRGGRPAPVAALNACAPAPAAPAPPAPPAGPVYATLVVESPVRSGQSIFHPGDVTVIGSVASGAEVMAGGSIHVYGALRGRAMAGTPDNPKARIFCQRLEAELVAIDGYYRTAEHLDAKLLRRPIQAWLSNGTLNIAQID